MFIIYNNVTRMPDMAENSQVRFEAKTPIILNTSLEAEVTASQLPRSVTLSLKGFKNRPLTYLKLSLTFKINNKDPTINTTAGIAIISPGQSLPVVST